MNKTYLEASLLLLQSDRVLYEIVSSPPVQNDGYFIIYAAHSIPCCSSGLWRLCSHLLYQKLISCSGAEAESAAWRLFFVTVVSFGERSAKAGGVGLSVNSEPAPDRPNSSNSQQMEMSRGAFKQNHAL